MGLKNMTQGLVVKAFEILGDFSVDAVYSNQTSDGFSPGIPQTQNLNIIMEDKGSGEYVNQRYGFSEQILRTDIVCMTPAISCDFPVKEGGVVSIGPEDYRVKEVNVDPAEAIYTMLLGRI